MTNDFTIRQAAVGKSGPPEYADLDRFCAARFLADWSSTITLPALWPHARDWAVRATRRATESLGRTTVCWGIISVCVSKVVLLFVTFQRVRHLPVRRVSNSAGAVPNCCFINR